MATPTVVRVVVIPFSEEFNEEQFAQNPTLLGFLNNPAFVVINAVEVSYINFYQVVNAALKYRHAAKLSFYTTASGDTALLSGITPFVNALGFSEFITWSSPVTLG